MLKDNLIEVEEHIKKACEKSGRNPEDVCLVAVSKTKPKDMLMEVYADTALFPEPVPSSVLELQHYEHTQVHYSNL